MTSADPFSPDASDGTRETTDQDSLRPLQCGWDGHLD